MLHLRNPSSEVAGMRSILMWFAYFILVCLLIGWAEVGITWMLCYSVLPPYCFWAVLSIPMTINMCLSFLWVGATWEKEANEH
jgi:hypothetical protein